MEDSGNIASVALAESGGVQPGTDIQNPPEVVGYVRRNVRRTGVRGLGDRLVRQSFVIYVALNMAVCSVVFAPWAQPRETISGLLGRWLETETGVKRIFASMAGLVVDAIYFWEVDHCRGVFHVERDARKVLYP